MKLFYLPGAGSLAPHIALKHAGASFSIDKVNLKTGMTESGADFQTINPRGYVPALELPGGEIVTECAAILQWIADEHPETKLAPPAGDFKRVRMNEALSFIASELHKAFAPFFGPKEATEAARPAAEKNLSKQLDRFEAMLADGRPYLLGDDYSVADIYAFVVLFWTNFVQFSLEPWPRTTAFMERIGAKPAVQDALADEGLTG